MNIAIDKINPLPVRTWNWLGINNTTLKATMPDTKAGYTAQIPTLPAGIQTTPKAPTLFANITTGMGANTAAWVSAHANSSYHLQILENIQITNPVIYKHNLTSESGSVIEYNTIVAEPNSEVCVVVSTQSTQSANIFHAGLTYIVAKPGAKVRLVQLQLLDDSCKQMEDIGVELHEAAQVEIVQIQLGAGEVMAGCKGTLVGTQASFNLSNLYLADKQRSFDFNYVAEHIAEESFSEIHSKGALFDNAKKSFRGTIDFAHGSARSTGHESEETLLFSNGVVNKSAPLILCGEEDVEGQHAATIGKINEAELFYLMSRGLNEKEAKHVVVQGRFTSILKTLPDDTLQEEATLYLTERMKQI